MPGSSDPTLPCPLLNIRIELPSNPAAPVDDCLQQVPTKPGVYLLQDESGGTLALASTANLRRMIASRLQTLPANQPTRRVNYRELTSTILATTVGSAFEADWAYLQLARIHLPRTYQSVLDRWQAWFISIDPAANFPQYTKTAHPHHNPRDGVEYFGPFADKHAAARYMDLLQDVFDLCRYHHILVQAPHGAACAYKEMGRCPAPCDGTVSMAHYHGQITRSAEFAAMPIEQWQQLTENAMQHAAASLDFETAGRLREELNRSKPATRPSYAHVRRLGDFRFIAMARSERKNFARIFLIRGGWIEPVCDLRFDSSKSELNAFASELQERSTPLAQDWCDAALENIGLTCWHLFRPRAEKPTLEMLRLNQDLNAQMLSRSLRRLARKGDDESGESGTIDEHEMESGSASIG